MGSLRRYPKPRSILSRNGLELYSAWGALEPVAPETPKGEWLIDGLLKRNRVTLLSVPWISIAAKLSAQIAVFSSLGAPFLDCRTQKSRTAIIVPKGAFFAHHIEVLTDNFPDETLSGRCPLWLLEGGNSCSSWLAEDLSFSVFKPSKAFDALRTFVKKNAIDLLVMFTADHAITATLSNIPGLIEHLEDLGCATLIAEIPNEDDHRDFPQHLCWSWSVPNQLRVRVPEEGTAADKADLAFLETVDLTEGGGIQDYHVIRWSKGQFVLEPKMFTGLDGVRIMAREGGLQ